jgi:hypothetical protein
MFNDASMDLFRDGGRWFSPAYLINFILLLFKSLFKDVAFFNNETKGLAYISIDVMLSTTTSLKESNLILFLYDFEIKSECCSNGLNKCDKVANFMKTIEHVIGFFAKSTGLLKVVVFIWEMIAECNETSDAKTMLFKKSFASICLGRLKHL